MTTGVLVMAYGTPNGPDDVETFYLDVRRGRPPTPEQLADLERRYQAIGGVSPLVERTTAQIAALMAGLEHRAPGAFRGYYGAKHSRPKIEEAIEQMASDGMDRLVGLVLAPHYSVLSVGEYIERARDKAASLGLRAGFIERWHTDPVLIELLAERVLSATALLGEPRPMPIEVVFTAHSLPARILELGDRYADELAETAALVAETAGLSRFRIGWQSAGRTPEPWIGPDLLEILEELKQSGVASVVVCPAGFTSDHLEVLYDLDIEARSRAAELGIAFSRTASLNDEPRLFASLANQVLAVDQDLSRH